jgi:hypothetical protein
MVVPFCFTAFSSSAGVRVSCMPAEVSSSRIGAIIISGYIPSFLHWGLIKQFRKLAEASDSILARKALPQLTRLLVVFWGQR